MTYTKLEKGNWGWIVVIALLLTSQIFSQSFFVSGFLWGILVILIMFLGIQYKLQVQEGHIEYDILFLSITVYKKVVQPNKIHSMKFKRTGWSKKKAVIKLKNGINIRVIDFEPANAFEEIEMFAHEHYIPVKKTKDYLILEKYY